jgi:hypothetical protein
MSSLQSHIEKELSEIISALSQPFPSAAGCDGWTEQSWQKWRSFFEEARKKISSRQPIPDASITRAMDFDGVTGGVLLEKAARVSNQLRELRSEMGQSNV